MYLQREEVQQHIEAITAHVPRGEAAFDAFNRLGVWAVQRQPSVKATGATLHWGIDDARELEAMVPRLKLVADLMRDGGRPMRHHRSDRLRLALDRTLHTTPFDADAATDRMHACARRAR